MRIKSFKIMSPFTVLIVILVFSLICCPVTVSGHSYIDDGMTMSQEGINMIKQFEGFAKYPYWDYSQYTVGYGTHCPSEDLARYQKDGITEEEAEELLKEYILQMEISLNTFIKRYGWELNQAQFDALGSFTYNCGVMWAYNSTGIKNAITNNVTGIEFVQELARWCNAGGKVLPGLINRRLCEGKLYTDGVYSNTRPTEYSYVYLDIGDGTCDYKAYIFDNTKDTEFTVSAALKDAEFLGWFNARENGQQVVTLNNSIKSGSTLYANYKLLNNTQVPVQPMPDDETTPPTEETTPTTPPEDTTVAQELTVTGDYVNVRESHSTSSRVCGHVVRGDVINVTEIVDVQGTYWGKINGGWVCLTYTNYKSTAEETPEEQPKEEPKEEINAETVDLTGVIYNCDHLNVRVAPGTHNKLLTQIKGGTKVKITERAIVGSTYWGHIEQGWISMDYVRLDSDNTESDTPAEPVLYTGTVKDCGALNVRVGAGTHNDKCGILYPSTVIMIYETKDVNGTTWGRFDDGWVSLDYVDLVKNEDASTEEPSNPETSAPEEPKPTDPTPEETPEETPESTQPSEPENTTPEETVPSEPETEPTTPPAEETKPEEPKDDSSSGTSDDEKESLIVTVTKCTGLNVRESYGLKYKAVKILEANDKLVILEQKYIDDMIWGRCEFGWISMKYVDFDTTNPLDGQITAGSLRIRDNAGMSGKVVGYYKLNNTVRITEIKRVNDTNWGKTDKGWISMDYVIIR